MSLRRESIEPHHNGIDPNFRDRPDFISLRSLFAEVTDQTRLQANSTLYSERGARLLELIANDGLLGTVRGMARVLSVGSDELAMVREAQREVSRLRGLADQLEALTDPAPVGRVFTQRIRDNSSS